MSSVNTDAIVSQINDGFWPRALLILYETILFYLGLFSVVVFFKKILQVLAQTPHLNEQSQFYSTTKSELGHAHSFGFEPPHITTQMPIRTKSLQRLVAKAVASLQKAISYHQDHSGSARIFVNDGGIATRSDATNAGFEAF